MWFRYIIEEGQVEVWVDDVKVNELGPGEMFGELALMYDIPRQASW